MRQSIHLVSSAAPTPVPGRMLVAGGQGDAPADRTSITPPLGTGRPRRPASLLLVSTADPALVGSAYDLDAADRVIGRMAEAGICLDDPGVSRAHVRLARDPSGQVVAEDLGSTNGTFVNGVAIRRAVLVEGDRLQIGTTTELIFGGRSEEVQAEIRLRQALSTAGAGTWEWLCQANGLRLHGGVVGASIPPDETTDPRGDGWARVHPDDRPALAEHLRQAAERGGRIDLEARLLRRGGGDIWVAIMGEPFRDEAGRVVRLAGGLLDVTERRRVETELRRQSLLFESLADAVVVVGSEGTILEWSASAALLLGWTREEVLGRRPGALLSVGRGLQPGLHRETAPRRARAARIRIRGRPRRARRLPGGCEPHRRNRPRPADVRGRQARGVDRTGGSERGPGVRAQGHHEADHRASPAGQGAQARPHGRR